MTAPPRDAPPETAHAAARQLSHLILEGEWAHHLRAIVTPLSFDRTPYALDADVEDVEQLRTAYVLWLTCYDRSQPQIQRASEALALLQLVRELDPAQWLTTLESLWPNEFEDLDQLRVTEEELLMVPVLVGLYINVETTDHVDWVFERVVGSTPSSSRYHADFEAVQEALGEYTQQAEITRIPVSLKIHRIDLLGSRSRLHEQLLQIAIMQHRFIRLTRLDPVDPLQPIQGKQERTCFQVVELDLDGPASSNLCEHGLICFARIATHGVRLTRLTTLKLEGEPRPATTQALQSLFPTREHPHRQYFGVKEVDLSDSISLDMVAPVVSALQVSQSVRKVTIMMESHERIADRAHRRTLWQWIAYALFSKHARHNIREVEVDMEFLGETDVAAFQAAVANPLEWLNDSAPCQYVEPSRFSVERHFKLYPFPISAMTAVRVVVSEEREQAEYWRVILPGCGVAMLHKDDATQMPGSISRPEDMSPMIRHLTLANGNEESRMIGYSFLDALPCRVESIEFTDQYDYRLYCGGCYTPVLSALPGLKRLITPTGFVNDGLMEVAELAVDGKCELEALTVSGWINLRGSGDVIEFIEVLAEVDHPLSRNLCELELYLTDGEPAGFDDFDTGSESEYESDSISEFMAALHKMLTRNRRLHTFTLHLIDFNDDHPICWPDEDVAIRTAPLALSSKLALLSIARGSDSTLSTKSLDSAILSIIFEFAAEHCIRSVIIL